MFDSSVLNVVIGLIFIFLIYSLFATAVQEAISSILQRRGGTLYRGVVSMLTDTPAQGSFFSRVWAYITSWSVWQWARALFKKPEINTLYQIFYHHPIIKNYGENALYNKPAYLTSENFASILVETIKNLESANEIKPADFKMIQDAIVKYSNLPAELQENFPGWTQPAIAYIDCETFKILNFHLNEAAGDLDVFKARLEKWFDDSMARVSGWYKRNTQTWLFIIGFFLAMILNIDSIQITKYLSRNKEIAAKLADMGTAVAANTHYKDSVITAEIFKEVKAQKDSVNTLLGLGWKYKSDHPTDEILTVLKGTFATSWTNFFGIFISAIAISLGAPFWFDLLNKFVNIRASGKTVKSSGSTTKTNKSDDNTDG
ncbi:hypothetical protein [Mucilaginibacter sp.]|jgi:hypothetical protein|uniref:hypothetical protein n=1 Tax=Mucilaginibacter sp. TaxID=1882438 RepID=UPI002D02ABB7|nr:hypothetical protein [Mucilaginibacter sp.]HTI59345.1 hypothetical protein [Mucilaginibacter sp.]